MQKLYKKIDENLDSSVAFAVRENFEYPLHWNEGIEIIYVLDGNFRAEINNKTYHLESRDILLIGGGELHSFPAQFRWSKTVIIALELSVFESLSININDYKFLKSVISKCTDLNNNREFQVHQLLENQILSIKCEFEKKQKYYQMAVRARIYEIMVTIARQVHMEEYSLHEKSKKLDEIEKMQKIYQYVESNYGREISLADISREVNLSVSHCIHFFKCTAGMTFGQYLADFRIRKAEWYLKNTGETITSITYKVGFNNIKTFNRVFKQKKCCSPSKYRKNSSI